MKYYVNINKENMKYLHNKQINNLRENKGYLNFETNTQSLKKLLEDISDLSYINKRKIKIITFIKKYIVSIISIILLLLFLINEQIIVKKLEFVNENTYNQEVVDYIYNNSLKKQFGFYYLKKELNEINKELKNNFFYYEWISINKKGNVIVIIIDKQDEKSYLDTESNVLGDIVASESGIIRYYFIKKGVNLIKDNQSVNKGDVLISGNLLIKKEQTEYIHPIGIVLAEVVSIEKVKVDKIITSYIRTGKIKIIEKYIFFNKFKNNDCDFEMYEMEESIIFGNKYLKKIKVIYYEVKEVINYYTQEEAQKYAYSIIEKNFNNNIIHEKERIIESFIIDFYEDDKCYYYKYLIKKIINISQFKAVNLEDK